MKWLILFWTLWLVPTAAVFSQDTPYFGALRLQSYDRPDLAITQQNFQAWLQTVPTPVISPDGQWLLVPGLADLSLVSIESVNDRGSYLTQDGDRVLLRSDDRTLDLRRRATFRRTSRNTFAGTVTFESLASPGLYLTHTPETSALLLRRLVTVDDLKAASFLELLPDGGRPPHKNPEPVKTVFESLWFPAYVLRVFGEDLRPVPRSEVNPPLDAVFLQRPGLAGGNTVSLESASKPGFFVRARQGRMRIEALSPDEAFRQDASFIKVTGLADPNGVSFQSLATPTYYIGVNGFYETYLTFISNDVDRKLVTFFERQP